LIDDVSRDDAHWYLLQTKYKQEHKAADQLRQQNISIFLPQYKFEKIINGNKVIKNEPLFSRYLFAWLEVENTNWTSVRSTRGVSNFVKFGNRSAIVEQRIIDYLKKCDLQSQESYIKIGEIVKIASGSLKGFKAIYKAADGDSRSYILLNFMQQNQYLSIDNQLIRKL
jgi:transcriptional antiterminator RfaH